MTFMTKTSEAAPRISPRLAAEPELCEHLSLESLGDLCSFPWFRNGWEFVHQGRRVDIDPSGAGTGLVRAVVHGGETYDTALSYEDDQLSASCSCPFDDKDGHACKHAAALGLVLLGYPDIGLRDLVWDKEAGAALFDEGRFDEFARWALATMNPSTTYALRVYNTVIVDASRRLREVVTNRPVQEKHTTDAARREAFAAHAHLAAEYVAHVQRRFGGGSTAPSGLSTLLINHATLRDYITRSAVPPVFEGMLVEPHVRLAVNALALTGERQLVDQALAFHLRSAALTRDVLGLYADCVYDHADAFRTARFHQVARLAVKQRALAAKALLGIS